MNERIKELMLEAGLMPARPTRGTAKVLLAVIPGTQGEIGNPEAQLQEFAELIVLECAAYLNGAVEVYNQNEQDVCDRAARHIKQHFGVE
jgi:hypothetical protein